MQLRNLFLAQKDGPVRFTDSIWFATEPMDMRAGTDTTMASASGWQRTD